MTEQVKRPEWDALCLNPIETAKYILYFDKEVKFYCLDKVEWFAHILRFDPDPDIRKVSATKYEFVALNLIKDESEEVRAACAEHWESCAKYLYFDTNYSVQWACLTWDSCKLLMLLSQEEIDDEILQELALEYVESDDLDYVSSALETIDRLIQEDEDFALACKDSDNEKVRLICAERNYQCALSLVFDLNDEVRDASISRLFEDNDWYGLDSEELQRLCGVNEEIALAILDVHLDDWDIRSTCVRLYESCAFELLLDSEEEIADYAKMVVLASHDKKAKLELLNDPYHFENYAAILVEDKDAEIRKACAAIFEFIEHN